MNAPLAQVIDVPTWSGVNCSVADVLKAVDNLRRSEQRAATRTSVANLVISAKNADEVDDAETVIDHLGVRHPARIITLLASSSAVHEPNRLDADVTFHAGEAAGHAIWSDEVRLRVAGSYASHVESLLRPLLMSDLPTFVWYVRGLPAANHGLLHLADAVIVDTKTAVDYTEGEVAMHRVCRHGAELTHNHTIIDLSWNRLRPWRKLLAALFEGEVYRPFIHHVERAEVTGKLGPRTLLAGWLAGRLGLDRPALHLYDGRHVAIKLICSSDGRQGEFSVERVPGQRLVRASAAIEDGPSHTELLGLPNDALPFALSGALKRLERDEAYEQAIAIVGTWD